MFYRVTYRILACICTAALFFTACGPRNNSNNKLIGKWEHTEPTKGITVTLEFTRDKIDFSAEGVAPANTSYTYIDENTIKYRNLETGLDVETSYTIDGDKLTIAFYGDTTIEYTRVK
jgi:hypothetical protein